MHFEGSFIKAILYRSHNMIALHGWYLILIPIPETSNQSHLISFASDAFAVG